MSGLLHTTKVTGWIDSDGPIATLLKHGSVALLQTTNG